MTPGLIAYVAVLAVASVVAIALVVIGVRKQVHLHGFGSGLGPEARPWVTRGAAILASVLLLTTGSWIGVQVVAGDRLVLP